MDGWFEGSSWGEAWTVDRRGQRLETLEKSDYGSHQEQHEDRRNLMMIMLFVALKNCVGFLERNTSFQFIVNFEILITKTFWEMFQICHGTWYICLCIRRICLCIN